MNNPWVRDAALVVLRLILGVIFIAHGWDKVFVDTMPETGGQFAALGVPQAEVSAWIAAFVELLGGGLLILGLLTTAVAAVLALEMLLAFWFAHATNGIFVADGGSELVLALFGGLIILIAFGAGRASLDKLFT